MCVCVYHFIPEADSGFHFGGPREVRRYLWQIAKLGQLAPKPLDFSEENQEPLFDSSEHSQRGFK